MTFALRPYQLEAIDKLRGVMREHRRTVLVVPTGGGKTAIGSEIVRRVVANGGSCLWLAHRAELVDQAAATLTRAGLTVGGFSASAQTPPNPFAPVQVATVQTMLARSRDTWPRATFLVADEAHHYVADEFITVVESYADALVLGLTATPERSDGRGLGELFGGLVVGATVKQLTADGHLVPCEVVRPDRYLKSAHIAQHPADAYAEHANGRRTVVFARSVELAQQYAEDLCGRGIAAACVHGEMPALERAEHLYAFRAGRVSVLVNVYVLTEGWDCPEASCVILARGCSTAGTYLQMVGRALRPAPGKTGAILVDLRGVSHDFGRPDDDREYSLDGAGIRLKDKAVYCPVCGAERESGEPCAACGWKPAGEPMAGDTITGDPLVKYAQKRLEGPEERSETLARWMRTANERRYNSKWALARFKAVYGSWPPAGVVSAAYRLYAQPRPVRGVA